MGSPLVAVLISTRAEFNIMRRGLEILRVMGVPYLFESVSSYRSPRKLEELALGAGERGIEVIIVACGGTSHLATHLAAYTNLPIIGVPIDGSPLRGQDALYSMVMSPPGLPIATVGINNSENAAVLAAQILALKHSEFRTVLAHRRMQGGQRLESMHKELCNDYPDICLPERTMPDLPVPGSELETAGGDDEQAARPGPSSSVRIQPGAVWTDRPSGAAVSQLVSTPVPQEPLGSVTYPTAGKVESAIQTETETPVPIDSRPRNADIAEMPTAPLEPEDDDQEGEVPTDPIAIPENFGESSDETSNAITPTGIADTKVFSIDRENINEDLVDHVMMVLLEGGIVAIPTDTVYGLAADATNREAIDRLCRVKGRQHQKTVGVLIHHPDMLEQLVREVPPALESVIEKYWPGALTIIFPKQPGVLPSFNRSDRIGVRIPSDLVCLAVLERIGRPVVVRNASLSPDHPMTNSKMVTAEYDGHIDCILDAGECPSAGASTVLSAVGETFEILREGSVAREDLKALLEGRLKD